MKEFIPELKLSEQLYHKIVQPILEQHLSDLKYSAALIGEGSGVLGLDNELSADHDWGPRLLLFVSENEDPAAVKNRLDPLLPQDFLGHPIRFSFKRGEVASQVTVHHLSEYLNHYLGVKSLEDITLKDWLTFPEHRLLCLTGGKVFHDGLNQLNGLREKLAYYPRDVWLYMLASQWQILSEEMPFVGRTGELEDDLGSRIIASSQVGKVMKMAFLLEKQYTPYAKWLGTAFGRLRLASDLSHILIQVLQSTDWRQRELHLIEAYKILVQAYNELNLTKPLPVESKQFYTRPYLIVEDPRPQDIQALIQDQSLAELPIGVGGVDQITDNVAILVEPTIFKRIKSIYSD